MRYGKSLKIATIGLFVGFLSALIPFLPAYGAISVYVGINSDSTITSFDPNPYNATGWNWNVSYNDSCTDLGVGASGGGEQTFQQNFAQTTGNNKMEGLIWPIEDGTYWLCFGKVNIFEYLATTYRTGGVWTADTSGPRITATAPATGSTITDTEDTLTIDYFNIDAPYTGFTIGFQDNIIFSNSESILFNTTGSGTEVISLADFGITTNGHWDLKGFAFGTHLDIQDGFLTTRGYIDFFSEPLVDPAYYLLFDVAGLATPYTFTDPTDWYDANVDRFPAPTAFFTSFIGLLDPIFLKVAEFGRQVEPMFDSQGAYDRGHALGEIFPFIGAYVEAINVFCGGFPMVGFFIAIILILTAMFVIRTIIKFIPFTGN